MFNSDRDFIFDNFELEDEDNEILNNESVSVVKPVVETTVVSTEEKVFPSINLNELTDEQTDKLFNVLGNGVNKILHDLCNFDDDYLPF